MAEEKSFPRSNLYILIVVLVLTAATTIVCKKREESTKKADKFTEVPQFTFTEHSGRPFGRDDLNGRISVVNFFYTRGKDTYPVMAEKMEDLHTSFASSNRVQLVSITVAPEHDTPEVLQQYAIDRGVKDNRWVFLYAPVEQVIELSEKGFSLPAGNLPEGHSSKLILVDHKGMICGYFDYFDNMNMTLLKLSISKLHQILDE